MSSDRGFHRYRHMFIKPLVRFFFYKFFVVKYHFFQKNIDINNMNYHNDLKSIVSLTLLITYYVDNKCITSLSALYTCSSWCQSRWGGGVLR